MATSAVTIYPLQILTFYNNIESRLRTSKLPKYPIPMGRFVGRKFSCPGLPSVNDLWEDYPFDKSRGGAR